MCCSLTIIISRLADSLLTVHQPILSGLLNYYNYCSIVLLLLMLVMMTTMYLAASRTSRLHCSSHGRVTTAGRLAGFNDWSVSESGQWTHTMTYISRFGLFAPSTPLLLCATTTHYYIQTISSPHRALETTDTAYCGARITNSDPLK